MDAQKTGEFIAQQRKELGLTQAQLAEKLFVSDKVISRWETGKGFPDLGNLEHISETLGVSIAELLKGEKLPESVPKEETGTLAIDILDILRRTASRREAKNILVCFVLSLVIVAAAVIHLTSPLPIVDPQNALKIETLSDGRIVAVLNEKVSGYDLDTINIDNKESFISCWTTRWDQLTRHRASSIVVLGSKNELGDVYYYPCADLDQLIYEGNNSAVREGVKTLPRLVYNYWIFLGLIAGIAGLVIYAIVRKKHYAGIILKLSMLPIALAIGTLFVVMSVHGEVYNATFLFSGIIVLTALLYALFLIIYSRKGSGGRF